MTAQFQFFQSLPHKKANFVKKKPVELGVVQFEKDFNSRKTAENIGKHLKLFDIILRTTEDPS